VNARSTNSGLAELLCPPVQRVQEGENVTPRRAHGATLVGRVQVHALSPGARVVHEFGQLRWRQTDVVDRTGFSRAVNVIDDC
jgi:hypothetical protein